MKVLLVDDHAIVRSGLRRLLAAQPHAQISEAATGRDALALVQADRPDLVVLDLNLPDLGGFELLRRILREHPPARVLVLSMHVQASFAARAIQAGACGYMSKNAAPAELLKALRVVAEGGRYIEAEIAQAVALQTATAPDPANRLTERDLEIVRQLGAGRSLTEIATALGLGYKTVANACTQIKAKLGVGRTADLIRLGAEAGEAKPLP
jgi:two-component system, NarL family, invasion response regulator UvrY